MNCPVSIYLPVHTSNLQTTVIQLFLAANVFDGFVTFNLLAAKKIMNLVVGLFASFCGLDHPPSEGAMATSVVWRPCPIYAWQSRIQETNAEPNTRN